MVVLTPLGLLAPGGAFGEDAPQHLDLQKYDLDAVPNGLRHYAGLLAQRAVRRLRLHQRQPPGARLPGFRRRRHRRDRRAVSSRSPRSSRRCAAQPSPARTTSSRRVLGMTTPNATPVWLLETEVGLCPVWLHRHAPEGQLRREDHQRRFGRAAPGDVLRRPGRSARAAPTHRAAGQAVHPARPADRGRRSCATSRCSSPMYVATLVVAAASGLSLGVLRQARLAVRPDLHRDRRAPGDLQLHHPRRHRRAARYVVRSSRRHDAVRVSPRPA